MLLFLVVAMAVSTILTVHGIRGRQIEVFEFPSITFSQHRIPKLLEWRPANEADEKEQRRNPFQFAAKQKETDDSPTSDDGDHANRRRLWSPRPLQLIQASTETTSVSLVRNACVLRPFAKMVTFRLRERVMCLDGRYVVRRIGAQSVDIAFVGQPREEPITVAIAAD